MAIFSALNTAVSGLSAQSAAIGNISENIANASTTGFKRVETSFTHLVTESNSRVNTPGTVIASPIFTNSIQGDIETSEVETHIAISGSGYFVVAAPETVDADEIFFASEDLFTRRGDFDLNEFGFLENGSGLFLQGQAVINQDTLETTDVLAPVNVTTTIAAPVVTTEINYNANLPAQQASANTLIPGGFNSAFASTVVLNGAPVQLGVIGSVGTSPVGTAPSTSDFLDGSLSGGAVTIFDSLGSPTDVQFRWTRVESNVGPDNQDRWQLFVLADDNGDTNPDNDVFVRVPSGAATPNGANDAFVFENGVLIDPSASVTLPAGLPVGGITLEEDITIDLLNQGAPGLTQFNDDSGLSIFQLDQNGSSAGNLSGLFFDDDGFVIATFDNGVDLALAQIPLAVFPAENQLERVDGQAFTVTPDSGTPVIQPPGVNGAGDINGSALEGSNVDIAEEFTDLIVAQRVYSANARIITTADELLAETVNLV